MLGTHGLDLLVLGIYLIGVVGYGCWFARKAQSSERFISAGRSIPGWAVGMSILGSYISSISFIANPGKAYSGNWNAFVLALSMPLAAWISVKYFVPFYRRHGYVSAYEHFESRFGPWARTYGVVCFLLTQLVRLGAILYLLALAFAPLTGLSLPTIIVISGIAITIYPLFGGTEGVIWTGVVQSIVLVGGVVVCLIAVVMAVDPGISELFRVAIEHHKFSLGALYDDKPEQTLWDTINFQIANSTFWVVLFYGLVTHLQNFGIDQGYVQRYATAKTELDAKRSVWMGGLCFIPLSAAFFFIGTGLYVVYSQRPGDLPPGIKPDQVFPHFIGSELPAGVMGLVLAAIFSAAMDSNLNCCATLYLCDIHRRYFRPNASERESMLVLHVSTLVMGALSILVALALIPAGTALDVWWKLAGIFSGGMLGLFLLGMMSRRAQSRHAAIGVCAGVVVIAWMSLSQLWKQQLIGHNLGWMVSPFHDNVIIVAGTLTILLVGLATSRFANPQIHEFRTIPDPEIATDKEAETWYSADIR
jgi:SSS family solute:Na+ symporter